MFQLEELLQAAEEARVHLENEPEEERAARESGNFLQQALRPIGTAGELSLAAARGALAIPAGVERLVIDPLFPGEQDTLRDLVERTKYSQQVLQEVFGNDDKFITNFVGEMAGAMAVGAPVLKGAKFLVSKWPGVFKVVNPESAKFAGTAIGVESGLFVAGIDPETSAAEIGFGVAGGALIGAAATRLLTRSAAKGVGKLAPEQAAEVESNLRLTAPIADDVVATSDEAIAGIKVALSAAGEGGALRVSRATKLTPTEFGKLAQEFPDYRFEQVGDDILMGLKPGQQLPEGTRAAPSLTDKVIADFQRTGFLRDQKLLLDGTEEVTFLAATAPREHIVASIVRSREGQIFRGQTHADALNALEDALRQQGVSESLIKVKLDAVVETQMRKVAFFETSKGRIVNRREAMNLAKAAGIPAKGRLDDPGLAFAEGFRVVGGFKPPQKILVKASGHNPFRVTPDRVSRATGEVGGVLENTKQFQEFIEFRASRGLDDIEEAITSYINTLDDLNPAYRPHLAEYLSQQFAKRQRALMDPDQRAVFDKFRAARSTSISLGRVGTTLEERAAAKGLGATRISEGRVQLTDMATGRSGPEMFFADQDAAKAFIDALEVHVPNVSPKIPGIAPELLEGVATPAVPLNPAVDALEQVGQVKIAEAIKKGPGAVQKLLYNTAGRWFRGVEAAALDVERVRGIPIWTEAIRPLSQKMIVGHNRGRIRSRQFLEIIKGLDEREVDLLREWQRSKAKDTFAKAHNMSPALVARARKLPIFFRDVGEELSMQSGTKLNIDALLNDYVPESINRIAIQGDRDLIASLHRSGRFIPDDLTFWNEMFKSGELGLEQASFPVSVQRMLRAGYRKAFAGEEFDFARQYLKTLDDIPAQRVLADYLTGVMGNWDMARQALRESFEEVYRNLGVRARPGQIGTLVDEVVGASYGALMGWRMQLAFRNHIQMLLLWGPVAGFSRVLGAYSKAATPEVAAWARRIGAVRDQAPVTLAEALAPSARPLSGVRGAARRFERAGLTLRMDPTKSPHFSSYAGADEHNRALAAVIMRDIMETYIPRFQSGKLNATQFARKGKLDFFDESQRQVFFNILGGQETRAVIGETLAERATNYIAREAANVTNFLYSASQAPAWVRTALGKVFGSYSTFAFGYANYLQMLARNGTPMTRATRLAKHGLVNYAVVLAGSKLGLDLSRWAVGSSINYISGTGWLGGPHTDLVSDGKDLLSAPPWKKKQALERMQRAVESGGLGETVFNPNNPAALLIPGYGFARDIWMATEYLADDRPQAALFRALGFNILDPDERLSPLGGLGFPARRRRSNLPRTF
jgi:hypothetical protein